MDRVPERFRDRQLTLHDLDRIVDEFGQGCREGQQSFLEFATKCCMTNGERAETELQQRQHKFLQAWMNYNSYATDRYNNVCSYPFEPVNVDGFREFCYNCYKRKPDHDERDRIRRERDG